MRRQGAIAPTLEDAEEMDEMLREQCEKICFLACPASISHASSIPFTSLWETYFCIDETGSSTLLDRCGPRSRIDWGGHRSPPRRHGTRRPGCDPGTDPDLRGKEQLLGHRGVTQAAEGTKPLADPRGLREATEGLLLRVAFGRRAARSAALCGAGLREVD